MFSPPSGPHGGPNNPIWRPEVDDNWAITIVQPPILTYPNMVFYFLLGPQVLWNDLRGIFIKQRHWKTFWGIIHVDQASLKTDNVKAMSGGRINKTVYLCFHPLPVPMAARITKYRNKYVRRGLCLIYMFIFYFWSPSLARKMRKTNNVKLSWRPEVDDNWAITLYSRQFWPTRPWFFTSYLVHRSYGMIYGEYLSSRGIGKRIYV
jgi:hypothetical protein